MTRGADKPAQITEPHATTPRAVAAPMDASQIWEQLSQFIDRFADAWQTATTPPPLAKFVPAEPASLRRLTLVEVIKVDLEHRWQNRRWPKMIEQYLGEFPELMSDGGVPCDLIYEEFHVRKQQGDEVSVSDFCRRFPSRSDELRRLLNVEGQTQTTMIVANKRLPPLEVGQTIDDFELLSPLGKGAFATVFRARQCSMHRIVALKISRDHSAEPQTLAQLEHPHIVRIFDQRQLPEHKLRLLYMQYVPGGTLQSVLDAMKRTPTAARTGATLLNAVDATLAAAGEPTPHDSLTRYRLQTASWYEVVCWLGARLASALEHAHGLGILHRDIKPANVLVSADGQPKLADFNISCSKLDGATPAAYFGGTLAYMSPEQLEAYNPSHERRADEIDGRADVYSLGLILWELLTLKRPFDTLGFPKDWSNALPTMTKLRRAGLTDEARAALPTDCPRAIADVLLKCLEPDPDRRFATAGELARELDLCMHPRAHALLHGHGSLSSIIRNHPVTSTIVTGLIPNLIMSVLSVYYAWNEIVTQLSPDEQRVFFNYQVLPINSVAYILGLGYVIKTRGQLFLTLSRLARGEKLVSPPATEMVGRCLRLGAAVAVITALLWAVSGFIFPTWLRLGSGTLSQLSYKQFVHFVATNLLCGMIAATQSYSVITFFSVRYCYPWILQSRRPDGREMAELAGVARLGRIFLGLTVAVPFLALAALLSADVEKPVIAGLAVIGFLGCAIGYLLDLAIRADLAALATASNPAADGMLAGDSVESFLSGSRRSHR